MCRMTPENLIALESMIAASSITVEQIANEQRALVSELGNVNRSSTVATFAGMLASPLIQSNAYRLEAMVHLAVIHSAGLRHPSPAFARRAFAWLGNGISGRMEDPAEDVFTTCVHSRTGNYTVFEGLREGNGFYLQRVLDVVDEMPETEPFAGLRQSVTALLALSDAVASRSSVAEFILGESQPLSELPRQIVDQLGRVRSWVRFSSDQLQEHGVSLEALRPFIFEMPASRISQQAIGHTFLERCPVLRVGDSICLALPTAVGSAVTRFIIERIRSLGLVQTFQRALARGYGKLLSLTPLVRKAGRIPIHLHQERGWYVGSALAEVDPGRFFHLVALVDDVDDLETTGFSGITPASIEQSRVAMQHIAHASEAAKRQNGFREGFTLVVGCGVGRGSVFALEAAPKDWRIECIPVHDAVTMSWMDGFDTLNLWRLLDSKAAIEKAGITLFNVNGLLNLLAWAEDLNGHLVPHGDLPDNFRSEGSRMVVVRQNALLDLRKHVYARSHTRVALTEDGVFVRVRKFTDSIFEDDNIAPLYVDEEALSAGELRAVYASADQFWWAEIIPDDNSNRSEVYEHWRMLCTWLQRTIPVLEAENLESLPRVVALKFRFQNIIGVTSGVVAIPTSSELMAAFHTSVDVTRGVIAIGVGTAFQDSLANPDNIAEQALVQVMVDAIFELSGTASQQATRSELLTRICPSVHARCRHRIHAQNFRDMVAQGNDGKPVTINSMDDGLSRIGLGFRVRPDVNGEITGVAECTSFLNDAAGCVLNELCTLLKSFNRLKFVHAVLRSHELGAMDREQWRRTAQANIALHGDSAMPVIVQHVAEMNACSIASRILIEAAICECPTDGGIEPGELDLSRAMAKAMFVFHVGGWSDAVFWGAIRPKVRITPLGDIHIDHTFMDEVYTPFVRTGGEREVRRSVDSYRSIYIEPEVAPSISERLEQRFLHAWECEVGVTVDALRRFVDEIENLGIQQNAFYFEHPASEVVSLLACVANVAPERATAAIEMLTLPSRPSLRSVTAGFKDKDWYPWRFRRRLSVVRRPFIQIQDGENPSLIVAPAVLREAVYILLRSLHSGETPDWQVQTTEMRQWLGHVNNVERTAFNRTVASKMAELGWKSEPDYKVSELLGIPLDRNYGDVDTLAWDPESCRVIAIECKDLHFHKTLGEVAEQLSDFRGVVKANGKRDLLRKHLDRLAVLEANRDRLRTHLGLKSSVEIHGYVVFRNAVPMQFAWEKMKEKVKLLLFDELDTLRIER